MSKFENLSVEDLKDKIRELLKELDWRGRWGKRYVDDILEELRELDKELKQR